jgi:hypothetical protein
MVEMGEKPIDQEMRKLEARIGRTIDVITSADSHGFTGFTGTVLEFGSDIDDNAATIFLDKKKPEGQQEVQIPMDDLVDAYGRIVNGTFDDEKGTYICQACGQQKTVEGKRTFALSNHILAWKLGPLGHPKEMPEPEKIEVPKIPPGN